MVRGLALGRVVFGAVMMLKPEEATRGWIGSRPAAYGGTQTVVRAFGARDLALGAGALSSLIGGAGARDWVLAGAACDVVDLVATVTADDLPAGGRAIVTAMAGAAIAVSAGYLTATARR